MTEPGPSTAERAVAPDGPLRCLECGGRLADAGGERVSCRRCGAGYPIEGGTVRMLPRRLDDTDSAADPEAAIKRRTGASFGYEWGAFGHPRAEWRKNFLDYMRPHSPGFFDSISVLDVGTGSGRHADLAVQLGARVVAVDIGSSIDVARRNLPPDVVTVQADAEELPFAPGSFDFVMSIGVLHHLPDTGRALRALVPFARPGGHVHIYLYWQPTRPVHRLLLRGVALLRRLTTRLPHGLLHAACYPLAALLFVTAVGPYRVLRRFPGLGRLADALPLKAYADYPFGVLVNDQFDRFAAPIERRFTREQAERLMRDAGLEDVVVLPNNGWVCDGRRPAAPTSVAAAGTIASPRAPAPPVAIEPIRLRAVAAQSPIGPGFRIRVLLLRDELARRGVVVEPELLFSEAQEERFRQGSLGVRALVSASARRGLLGRLREDGDFDATLIQRQADMWPSLRLERTASDDRCLIWDVDDAVWHDTSKEARQHPLAVSKGTRRKVQWLAKRADHVIAGNRILADWLIEQTDQVTVVPSVVETRGMPQRQHEEGEEITLGWIGSPATARYLAPMRTVLTRLRRAGGGHRIRLLVVGGTIEPVEGIETEEVAWSPEAERRALSRLDIGLMPLPDTPWTRGKCAYKALQYMAAGIPAVADDVGVAAEVIDAGGRAVSGESEWVEVLSELAGNTRLRARMGAAARRRTEEHFSVVRWAPVVAEIVRGKR